MCFLYIFSTVRGAGEDRVQNVTLSIPVLLQSYHPYSQSCLIGSFISQFFWVLFL